MMHRLSPTQAARVRAAGPDAPVSRRPDGCGVIRTISPKRVAACRCCGKPIPAGARALQFAWDFDGVSELHAYRWHTCFIHPHDCSEEH